MIESKNISLERAVLVGIVTKDQDEVKSKEYLDELEFWNVVFIYILHTWQVLHNDINFLACRNHLG